MTVRAFRRDREPWPMPDVAPPDRLPEAADAGLRDARIALWRDLHTKAERADTLEAQVRKLEAKLMDARRKIRAQADELGHLRQIETATRWARQ